MILSTQMQKAKVLTIENGLFQAQYNGVVYQEYNPRFEKISFAGDAKHIFLALKTLANSYKVSRQDDKLYLFDTEQEFCIEAEIPDVIMKSEQKTNWHKLASTKVLSKLKVFATQDFPAYFLTKDYIEVLHPSMIVRTANPYEVEEVVSIGDFNVTEGSFCLESNALLVTLVNFSNAGICPCIRLGALDLDKPDTDSYFPYFPDNPYQWESIPQVVKDRWVPCDTAYFTPSGLRLGTQAVIEDVQGSGTYDGKLLAKIIRNCDSWCFDGPLLRFTNGIVYGVLENVTD